MVDRLVRGIVPARGLRAVLVRVGDIARMTRVLHGLAPTSAHLFGEALAGAALLGSLQKERGRVNVQVECDGRLRGLFVDADPEGNVRGWVKVPGLDFPGDAEEGARAALGRSGFLSVLRQPGESPQFYRSAVELRGEGLPGALRAWFAASEQVETALDLAVLPRGEERLGEVAGVLVQRLPDGDAAAVAAAREAVARGAFRDRLLAGATARELVEALAGPGFEPLAELPLAYRCGCSQARARSAVSVLGLEGVAEILAHERQAVVDCEFCHARYVVDEAALREIEAALRAGAQA